MSEGSERLSESERVEMMRLDRAIELGVPYPVAMKFAETPHADLHRLEDLIVKEGCKPLTAARILI